jgi:hypothetical protein
VTYEPGLNVGPGEDADYDSPEAFEAGSEIDTPGVAGGVDTPDPFGPADQASYSQDQTPDGPDVAIDYLPPWAITRAPGTVATIAAGEIIPVDPWRPEIALLNARQLAMLNRESAARQAASFYVDDPRQV